LEIYLTWYANPPDPYYWEWIPDLDGVVVSLASLRGRVLDTLGLRGLKLIVGRGKVIVDSLYSSLTGDQSVGTEPLQSWVLHVQRLLGANILVHRDIPLVRRDLSRDLRERLLRRTILNAELALRLAEKLGIEVMLVAQGWDADSYRSCARVYADLGARYVGVGSLVPRSRNPDYLETVLSAVREVVGRGVHLHLFGVSSPRAIARLARYVDSIDVSTPMRAAVSRELLVDCGSTLRRVHISAVGEELLFEHLGRVSRRLAEKARSSRSSRELLKYVAVYNARVLLDWIRRRLGSVH
jgi:queuine/archaeosine tRNA-ribosyltransferase